jgi:hypothetical protein
MVVGMTRKIAISVPDDVAVRLEREPNVSAFIADTVRRRMAAEHVRKALQDAGFAVTDEGVDRAAQDLNELQRGVTPQLRREAAALRSRLRSGRPE